MINEDSESESDEDSHDCRSIKVDVKRFMDVQSHRRPRPPSGLPTNLGNVMAKGLAAFLEHCDFRSLTVACRDTHERAFECNYKLVLYKRFWFSKDCKKHNQYYEFSDTTALVKCKIECEYCKCSICNQDLRYCGGCRRDIKPDDAACEKKFNPCWDECTCYLVNTFPDPDDCTVTNCSKGYLDYEEQHDGNFTAIGYNGYCEVCICKRCHQGKRYCNDGMYCRARHIIEQWL